MKIDFTWLQFDGVWVQWVNPDHYIWSLDNTLWPNTVEGRAMSKYNEAAKKAADAKREVREIKGRGQQVPEKFLRARDAEATKADLKAAAEQAQKGKKN